MDNPWIIIGLIVVCLALSGFFSGSEIALSALDKLTLKRLIKENPRRGKQIESLLSQPSRWLITVLIGNNLVNIAAASLATLLIGRLVKGTPGLIIGVVTGTMTFLILVFGEISPKRYAQEHSEGVCLRVAGTILFLSSIFGPLATFLGFLTGKMLNIPRKKPKGQSFTEKEIHTLIDISQEEGVLEKSEEELVHSALEFDERSAREIMTPRTRMVCIEKSASLKKLRKLINQVGYSRIPVYQDRIDNIVGIVYAKDLLNVSSDNSNLRVEDIIHPPIFVPYVGRLSEILRKLQKEKTHLAIVVGEYGGVVGLLTIEDLLEELVGEIEDEYDQNRTRKIKPLKDGSALIEADTDIDEVNEILNTHLPEKATTFESIGGLLITLLGRIPQKGETIEHSGLKIEVMEADEKQVKRVKITKKPNK